MALQYGRNDTLGKNPLPGGLGMASPKLPVLLVIQLLMMNHRFGRKRVQKNKFANRRRTTKATMVQICSVPVYSRHDRAGIATGWGLQCFLI
jgi:hypothetical protein